MHRYKTTINNQPTDVSVASNREGKTRVVIGKSEKELTVEKLSDNQYLLLNDHSVHCVSIEQTPDGGYTVHQAALKNAIRLLSEDEQIRATLSGSSAAGGRSNAVRAPMPGKVVKCLVGVGDEVDAGQSVVVVEAMKMENELKSTMNGKVKRINVTEGTNVESGAELVVIEPSS